MPIPAEPIGSIPRPLKLIEGVQAFQVGGITTDDLDSLYQSAVRDTIQRFEASGSPVITDSEQTKPRFATYSIHGLQNVEPGGVPIRFADGHVRQLPALTASPFRYKTYADTYLEKVGRF